MELRSLTLCSADRTEGLERVDEPVKAEANSQPSRASVFSRLSAYAADALRYWEPRRLIYNAVLAVVVLAHSFVAWHSLRDRLSFDLALGLFFLAVLANVAYCAAYVPDIFVQFAGLQQQWRIGRVLLLTVGTAFAATITHFFARGIVGN
jgi:hypothetical protein